MHGPGERITANGAFKTPSLRHPELMLPEGATGTEVSMLQDLRFGNQAAEIVNRLSAVGRQCACTPVVTSP